jgi:hypothetical protein
MTYGRLTVDSSFCILKFADKKRVLLEEGLSFVLILRYTQNHGYAPLKPAYQVMVLEALGAL